MVRVKQGLKESSATVLPHIRQGSRCSSKKVPWRGWVTARSGDPVTLLLRQASRIIELPLKLGRGVWPQLTFLLALGLGVRCVD